MPTTEFDNYDNHLGDIYYDKQTGFVYIFAKTGNVYEWIRNNDSSLIQAMSLTNSALDAQDSVRQVFFTTPTPPYECGDWYVDNNLNLYICQIAKAGTEIYEENDFIIASKYTDDTLARKNAGTLKIVAGQVTTIIQSLEVISQTIEDNRYYVDEDGNRHLISTAMSEVTQTIDQISSTISEQGQNISQITQTVSEISSTVSSQGNSISQLTQNLEGFKTTVSTTYETKSDATNKLNTAKTYAEGQASTAETNAKNYTDGELENYSTTTEMNSAITQKANEITTSVSETYITKTDSANNISTAKTEAINSANQSTDTKLQNYTNTTDMNSAIDTAKNNAINTADGHTDSKLTNYSTTTQMNSAINQKADEININVNKNTESISEITNTIDETTGNPIEIENAKGGKPIEMELYGDTYQKTYSGKNLLNYSNSYTSTNWNNFSATNITVPTINFKQGVTYYISADVKLNSGSAVALATMRFADVSSSVQNGQVINNPNLTNSYQRYCYTITPIQDFDGTLLALQVGAATSASLTFQNFMISTSNNYEEYEPYVGGTPSPNPDYPQDIEVVTGRQVVDIYQKNLLNIHDLSSTTYKGITAGISNQILSLSGTSTGGINQTLSNTHIKLKANTTYTLATIATGTSTATGTNISILLGNYSKSNVFTCRVMPGTNLVYYTPTVDTVITLFNLYVGTSNLTCDMTAKIMLLEGRYTSNDLPEYEPFIGENYEINLGKNLFPSSQVRTDKDWLTTNSDGSISIKYESGSNINFTNLFIDNLKIPKGNYILKLFVEGTYSGGNLIVKGNNNTTIAQKAIINNNVLTITNNNIENFQLYVLSAGTDCTIRFELEKGIEEPTSYSPYKEPIELCKKNDYKDYIRKSTGKNLFDKDNANVLNASINSSGVISSNNNCKTIYIPIQPNTTYTISKILSTQFRASVYDDEPTINSTGTNTIANFSGTTITITSTYNSKYLAVFCYITSDAISYQSILASIQIEKNSQATELEPYGVGKWYKYGAIGKVVLDGTEAWALKETNTNTCRYIVDNKNNFTNIKSHFSPYCNRLVGYADNTTIGSLDSDGIAPRDTGYGFTIRLSKDIATTVNDFKTWLSTHNTIVYYVLATPTITEITDEELINQLNEIELLEGVNNITISSDNLPADMYLKYYLHTPLSDTYVNHQEMNAQIKLTADSIIETVESKDKEQDNRILSAERTLTTQGETLNILGTNINKETGEVERVKIKGYTLDKDGFKITSELDTFNSLYDNTGTYYKDGNTILTQFTKDKTIIKDLVIYGSYYYGVDKNLDVSNFTKDDAMFIAEKFEDENGEVGFGHFYNGGD